MKKHAIAYVDATAKAYGGFYFTEENGFRYFKMQSIDTVHNNEVKAIEAAAEDNSFEDITIYSDSTVAIKRCSQKERFRNVSLIYIPRSFNRLADKLIRL